MPCYSPLRAVKSAGGGISFSGSGKGLSLPCGRCIGCRLERSRQWAVRIMHESKMHEDSVFITLTYDNEHLPMDGSLSVSHCQLFLKRLRERLRPTRIRFFLCGEYGEKLSRPHYHAIIFGSSFPDKIILSRKGSSDFELYESPLLSECWGQGFVSVGSVSFDSASYVANYATKKISGPSAASYYRGRRPEFLLMSRQPGVGASWIDRFHSDVYPSDEVIVKGISSRPPRYYDKRSLLLCLQSTADIFASRSRAADELEAFVLSSGDVVHVAPSRNARRLVVREKVARAKLSLKSRRLDNA